MEPLTHLSQMPAGKNDGVYPRMNAELSSAVKTIVGTLKEVLESREAAEAASVGARLFRNVMQIVLRSQLQPVVSDKELNERCFPAQEREIAELHHLNHLTLAEIYWSKAPQKLDSINRTYDPLKKSTETMRHLPDAIAFLVREILIDRHQFQCYNDLSPGVNCSSIRPGRFELTCRKLILTRLPDRIFSQSDFTANALQIDYVDLSSNRLQAIPEAIYKLTSMTYFCVSDNRLTELSQSIGNLVRLQKLLVNDNRLTELPSEIGNLTDLKALSVRQNHLSGGFQGLPDAIRNMPLAQIHGIAGIEDQKALEGRKPDQDLNDDDFFAIPSVKKKPSPLNNDNNTQAAVEQESQEDFDFQQALELSKQGSELMPDAELQAALKLSMLGLALSPEEEFEAALRLSMQVSTETDDDIQAAIQASLEDRR